MRLKVKIKIEREMR